MPPKFLHVQSSFERYKKGVLAENWQLVERAGNGADEGGSITAIYTVLAEGDDPNDPIVDAARAILDGHIVLSRHMADSGIYPAVDVEASVSRAMTQFTGSAQQQLATRFRQTVATYQENRELIAVGAYQPGNNAQLDEAIALWPAIVDFLRQSVNESVSAADALNQLRAIFNVEQEADEKAQQ